MSQEKFYTIARVTREKGHGFTQDVISVVEMRPYLEPRIMPPLFKTRIDAINFKEDPKNKHKYFSSGNYIVIELILDNKQKT